MAKGKGVEKVTPSSGPASGMGVGGGKKVNVNTGKMTKSTSEDKMGTSV